MEAQKIFTDKMDLVGYREAAAILRVTLDHLRHLVQWGRVRPAGRRGQRVLFNPSTLRDYLTVSARSWTEKRKDGAGTVGCAACRFCHTCPTAKSVKIQ